MSRSVRVPTLVAASVLVLASCSSGGSSPQTSPTPSASPTPTSLAEVDVGALPVVRTAFCDAVEADAVEAALGGPVAETAHYADGERARLTGDVRDVAHENGCTFLGADGVRARTWLFVPPVTPAEARELVAAAERTEGCAPRPDAPAYGEPSTALLCGAEGGGAEGGGTEGGGPVEATYRGLIGDAWLSCSLREPREVYEAGGGREGLLARTDAWCLEAASAAAT
ncbi:hypothetical protein [Nocardioides lentus]|uniref:hypothetical protein n=1 Tax=Nocardioides lentus TaxID=338077 RepID=UPI0031DC8941